MKKLGIIFLALFLGILAYIFVNSILIRNSNPEILLEKLEQLMQENQNQLELVSAQITNNQERLLASDFDSQFLFNLHAESKIIALFYKNDSLVFWNANQVLPDSTSLNILDKGETFLQLPTGYYQGKSLKDENTYSQAYDKLVLLKPLYLNYPYQNQYLTDKLIGDIFPKGLEIQFGEEGAKEHTLKTEDNNTLLSVDFVWKYPISSNSAFLLLGILLGCFGLFYWFILEVATIFTNKMDKGIARFLILLGAIIFTRLFFIQLIDHQLLFQSELFDSIIVSIGFLNLSFGLLTIDVFNLVVLAILFRIYIENYQLNIHQFWRNLGCSVGTILLFGIYIYFVRQLIYESKAPLSFTELYSFNLFSYFIFLYITLITISTYIIFQQLLLIFKKKEDAKWSAIGLFVVVINLICFGFYSIDLNSILFSLGLSLFYSISILFYTNDKATFSPVMHTWSLLLFAGLLTYLFYGENTRKSDSEQQLTALQLSMEADPMFEFVFKSVYADIRQDTVVQNLVQNKPLDQYNLEDEIAQHLQANYTHNYLDKYNISVTVCSTEDELLIKPGDFLTNCQAYFLQTVDDIGKKSTISPELYYMEDNLLGTYYLAVIELDEVMDKLNATTLFIEFYFKYIPEGLGYPELLIDESKGFTKLLSKYSLASYQDSVLIYKFGNYFYPSKLSMFNFDSNEVNNQNSFRHYRVVNEQGRALVVSKPQKKLIDIIAPFSYFSLLLAILGFLVIGVGFYSKQLMSDLSSFRFRLQIFSLTTLMLSFFIIGIISTVYIRGIYQEKSKDFLIERTQSILIEMEHKLRNEDINDPSIQDYLYEILTKFSQVFFSDINLYDLNGSLLATSRPEIFRSELISTKMNPQAFAAMKSGDEYLFLHQEAIGNGSFYSSYVSYRDLNGKTLAYINLPYFARGSEIRDEISNFIVTYINIFILLSGLFALIVLLFSRRLTKPLQMIQARMKEVRIDKINEPIVWSREDEIGELVKQYNQLISELAKSAELLARSERETAWREMAQQVAHEIKNPLTPMRLSVQHLKRSWENHDADMDQKIARTTQTLIEQIDTLSTIASAFSDFAKMPVSLPETVEIVELLKRTALLYNNKSNIKMQIDTSEHLSIYVFADKNNLGRAFANLIKNAVQAIGNKAQGKIEILLKADTNHVIISIADNGKGMNETEQKRVFTPNFTTKSSGMGIGLSIVNQIIRAASGTISFKSEEGKGTSFLITLPRDKRINEQTLDES